MTYVQLRVHVAKGRLAYFASLPATSDALIVIPIVASGVESDSTLVDYDTVSALLAGSTNEQAVMGRKTLTNVTVSIDDANDRVNIDADDVTWTAATGDPISDLLIAYCPDTTAASDSTMVPLTWHDFAITPDGSDITATISDFARCT